MILNNKLLIAIFILIIFLLYIQVTRKVMTKTYKKSFFPRLEIIL